ncbi:MAG: type II secretion system F family protein [Candidatus Diapherotrites archaeon]|nr:type II secretion system F family protein [Candidatus Diapherotrites archaeon]
MGALDALKKQMASPAGPKQQKTKLYREHEKSIFDKNPMLKSYNRHLKRAGIKTPAPIWIGMSLGLGVLLGAIISIFAIDFGILTAIVVIDLGLGMPVFIAQKKIGQLEYDFPDALKQMSTTFKAGGTFEYALKELAAADYGELSKELEQVLREVQSGSNMNNALQNFSTRVNSKLVKRTVIIMIDASKSGAGLANVFEEVAEDMRSMNGITRERAAKTMMQALFISSAGGIIAPAIFGIVIGIINFLIAVSVSSGIQTGAVITKAQNTRGLIEVMMSFYIATEALASSAMISSMREGNFNKTVIYFPALLFVAYSVFTGARIVMGGLAASIV